MATNLNINDSLPLGRILAKRYQVDIVIENDVRAGALGVQKLLGYDDVAYVCIGTGLAAGVVINQQIYRGKHGLAGEIGHIAELFGPPPPQLLENIVSGPGLVAQAKQAGFQISTPGELFNEAEKGSQAAQKVLDHFFYHLARAIQWVSLTFDIENIVIGGGVTRASTSFESYLRSAFDSLRQHSNVSNLLLADENISFLASDHNPGLWGATYLVKDKIGFDKQALNRKRREKKGNLSTI